MKHHQKPTLFAASTLLALSCAMTAFADSTLTISSDSVTLDGVTLADGKLTADTTVDYLNANGGTLDLNGKNLTLSTAYASRFSVTAQTTIKNTSETPATATFTLTSSSTAFGAQFRNLVFDGNLKLVVAGKANTNDGFQGITNTHTGGTEFDNYCRSTGAFEYSDNTHPRFTTEGAFGSGPLTLKNGSAIFYTGSNCTFPWEYLSIEGDRVSYIRLPNGNALFENPLKIAAGSTLLWCSERQGNLGQTWSGDMSEVYGDLLVNGTREGTFLAVNHNIPGTIALGASDGAQLQYRGSDGTFEVGALKTQDLTEYSAKAFVQNTSGLKTLKVGAASKDTVFYGNIACTGSKGTKDWELEKVGTGTLTLAGANTYLSSTVISGGNLKLVGVGTLGAAESTADIQFNGGTLEYGENVATDYSSRIKSSAGPISIDTGSNEITFATALPASNEGGLVKKGSGTLEVQGYSAYAGKTIVSNGTLKVGFQYNNTAGLGGRAFEKSNDASLEITLYNPSLTHASEATILTGIPDGSTVNFTVSNDDGRGLPRFTEVTTFSGILNFTTSKTTSGGAGGLVGSGASTLGSDSIEWNITGEPAAAHTRLFDVEGANSGAVAKFGALRQTSPNGMIYAKYGNNTLKIGALGKYSVINGQIETYSSDNAVTVQSIGGKLTLGENFAVVANGGTEYTGTATFNITGGAIENNADLSAFTVNLSEGVTISGTGTWPASMSLPASYSIPVSADSATTLNLDVDFSKASLVHSIDAGSLDETRTYSLLTANSISNWDTIDLGVTSKGKWRILQSGNSLVLKYFKNGLAVTIK